MIVRPRDLAGPDERGTTEHDASVEPAAAADLPAVEPPALLAAPDLEPGVESPSDTAALPEPPHGSLPTEAVRGCIIALQDRFGTRIERILASRGGLLVVMDSTDAEADRFAEGLSDQIPIALIDRRTLAGLQRLGAASPVAEGEILFEAGAAPVPVEGHPLARQAQAKLEGARVLLAQTQAGVALGGPALDLLLGALLCAAALLTGRTQPPNPREAGIWLYGEALPTGAIEPADAALVMRAIALAQAADAVPLALLEDLAADTEPFIQRVRGRA